MMGEHNGKGRLRSLLGSVSQQRVCVADEGGGQERRLWLAGQCYPVRNVRDGI